MSRELRVLLIEDNEDDAELLLLALKRGGYTPVWTRVQTAPAMRRALETDRWDVVLSDYQMPDFTGLRALEVLQKSGIDLPFIIISGTIGEETAVHALKNGAHDFLVKGSFARLIPAIEREMREAANRRERNEALRARDAFIADASHELRSPITGLVLQIAAALKLAREKQPELAGRLEDASKQLDRLTSLVNDLLDVTRIHANGPFLERKEIDLHRVVETVIDRRRDSIARSRSQVTFEGPHITGLWDPVALETVASNLLSNALKFGEGKPIELTLTLNGTAASLAVRDHGIGISAEEQSRLFRRFERPEPSRNYGGLGVGLWVARQVVEAHGGAITVASEPGKGSTFTVSLPLT